MSTVSAEVQAYLADPANKEAVLGALEADLPTYLAGKGNTVLKTTDYQAEKNDIFKQQATQIESALSEAASKLGIERPANVPIAEWAKTFAGAAVLKATPQAQPPKPGDQQGDPKLLAQISELNTKYSTLEAQFTQKEEAANKKIIESSIVTDLAGAKLGEKPEEQKGKLDALSGLLKMNHSPKVNEKGETVFHGPDGLPLVHADGRYKTALDITKEKYPFMLMPDAPKVEGLGLNGGIAVMSDHVVANNLDAINSAAAKNGFVKDSAEWKAFTTKSITASKAQYGSNFKV